MKTHAEGEWTIEFDPKGKAVRVALMPRGSSSFTIEMDATEAQRFAREQLRMAKMATASSSAPSTTSFLFRLGDSPEFVVSAENAVVFFRQLIETAQKARDGIN